MDINELLEGKSNRRHQNGKNYGFYHQMNEQDKQEITQEHNEMLEIRMLHAHHGLPVGVGGF